VSLLQDSEFQKQIRWIRCSSTYADCLLGQTREHWMLSVLKLIKRIS